MHVGICLVFTGTASFCRMVEKAKRHIFEGDIFQVVLSNRLEAAAEGSLLDNHDVQFEDA